MNSSTTRFALVAAATLIALACSPRVSAAQEMGFSYYSDAALSSNAQTVYGWIDGHDYSTGCTHYDYQTYAEFGTPFGTYSQGFPGLSAYFNAPSNNGSYTVWSSTSVSCSCFGSGLSAGGGSQNFDVGNATTYYQNCNTAFPGVCRCSTLACASGTATCRGRNVVLAVPNGCQYYPYVRANWKVIYTGSRYGCTGLGGWGEHSPGACT